MNRWFHFGLRLSATVSLSVALISCAGESETSVMPFPEGEQCSTCSEGEINAPYPGDEKPEPPTPADTNVYHFPTYAVGNPVPKALWDRMHRYYDAQWRNYRIRRYVTMVNLGAPSSKRRFWVLDLKTGAIQSLRTSHGAGSDPNRDGKATRFSNVPESHRSSLGVYRVSTTYIGIHGRSVRLEGLDSTNNNALERAIVIHGASYISESRGRAGLSFGCPALDPSYAQGVIDKIKDGSILIIDNIK